MLNTQVYSQQGVTLSILDRQTGKHMGKLLGEASGAN